uniref:glycosyltransferase family 4 protein n=1 Tax=Vibrio jasicida TaxID=766224 RepID=UPI0011B09805
VVNRTLVNKIIKLKKTYKVVGTVSVLREMKGIQYLIHALKYDKSLFVILVGDGVFREELERQCVEIKCQDRVIFAGKLEYPLDVLSCFDAFILLSEFEGFPISLLEAIAHKIPCVCNNIGLFREYFPYGCYSLANKKDPLDVINAIDTAINNKNYIFKAYEYYHLNYNWHSITKKYENEIIKVLK